MTVAVINTVGKVLNGLVDRLFNGIQATIEQYRLANISVATSVQDAGISLQLEAGRQVRLAIENLKNAYEESLEVTVDKVSPEIQKNLATITGLVEDVLNPKVQVLQDIAIKVQNLVLRLPLVDKSPYWNKTTPNFIAYSQENSNIVVRFFGHFPKDQKMRAALKVGGQEFQPEGDLNSLTSIVPLSVFCKNKSNAASLIDAELILNWEEGIVRAIHRLSTYKLWFGLLPSHPGQITIEYKKKSALPVFKGFISNEFYQHAGARGGGRSIIDKRYEISPEQGWKVVRGSSKLDPIEISSHNCSYSFVSDDRDQVVYSVTTKHVGRRGASGRIRFKITFNQTRDNVTEENGEEKCDLKWGETRVIDDPQKKFKKVVFTAFNKLRYELSGVTSHNPFIKIRNEGGKLVLTVATPEEISLLSTLPAAKL